jgi:hypothetical protein
MHRLHLHIALRDQSFERRIAAMAQAGGHTTHAVTLDAITNDMRRYDTLFLVEDSYAAILDLIEFHNSCHFNFLPTLVVSNSSATPEEWVAKSRFPYKYFAVERKLLPLLFSRVVRTLDQMRRAKLRESLLRLHTAVIAPFSAPGADFTAAIAEALHAILDHLFAARGSIMLINRYGNLVVEAATKRDIAGIEVPYDRASPAWSVVESGEPLFCEDITKDGRFAQKKNVYAKDYFLIVPIRIQGKTVGVLNLTDKLVSLLFDRGDLLRAGGLLRLLEPVLAARCGLLAIR